PHCSGGLNPAVFRDERKGCRAGIFAARRRPVVLTHLRSCRRRRRRLWRFVRLRYRYRKNSARQYRIRATIIVGIEGGIGGVSPIRESAISVMTKLGLICARRLICPISESAVPVAGGRAIWQTPPPRVRDHERRRRD